MLNRLYISYIILLMSGAFSFAEARDIAVFAPKGMIALQERNLIITTTLLMLIVVIPVFVLTFFFAWKYRATNKKAKYTPDWASNQTLEAIWWAIPGVIILVLAVITWKSTHELDPYKPLNSSVKPLVIQVVALDWKWLFIYPEQQIATVNLVEFPAGTPINFEITADAPMNSFWIPELGGQIYAMPGMKTKLHLIASDVGTYSGTSANFSGAGFSGMKFVAKSVSQNEFLEWAYAMKSASSTLTYDEYTRLAQPSKNQPVSLYSQVADGLYDKIVMKFMTPDKNEAHNTKAIMNMTHQ